MSYFSFQAIIYNFFVFREYPTEFCGFCLKKQVLQHFYFDQYNIDT